MKKPNVSHLSTRVCQAYQQGMTDSRIQMLRLGVIGPCNKLRFRGF